MKKAIYLFFTLLVLFSCKKEKASNGDIGEKRTYNVAGVAQKGPYFQATVTLKELNNNQAQTGAAFTTTTDDIGQYDLGLVSIGGEYALLEVNGEFFNEFIGWHLSLVDAKLKSLVKLEDQNWNVNIATHLVAERALFLISKNSSPNDAIEQAANELSAIFFTPKSVFSNAATLNVIGSTPQDHDLLAISAVLIAKVNSPLSYGAYINALAHDFKSDGLINTPEMLTLIGTALELLRKNKIEQNLKDYYQLRGAGTINPVMSTSNLNLMRNSGIYSSAFKEAFPSFSANGYANLFGVGDTLQFAANDTNAIIIVPSKLVNVNSVQFFISYQGQQNFSFLGGTWANSSGNFIHMVDMNASDTVVLPIKLNNPGQLKLQASVLTEYSSMVLYPEKLIQWQ